MPRPTDTRFSQAIVFCLLVAIGVVGRWGQPEYSVTPIAAVTLLAGYALPRRWAVAVPLSAMLITDLALPSYGSYTLLAAVYVAMAAPALLGRLLRTRVATNGAGLARLAGISACPALVFFLVTNLAVWATSTRYEPTAAGLAECYAAAVPFLRRMATADLAYTAVVFTAAGLAGAFSLRGLPRATEAGELATARVEG